MRTLYRLHADDGRVTQAISTSPGHAEKRQGRKREIRSCWWHSTETRFPLHARPVDNPGPRRCRCGERRQRPKPKNAPKKHETEREGEGLLEVGLRRLHEAVTSWPRKVKPCEPTDRTAVVAPMSLLPARHSQPERCSSFPYARSLAPAEWPLRVPSGRVASLHGCSRQTAPAHHQRLG